MISHRWVEDCAAVKRALGDDGDRYAFLTDEWYAGVASRIHLNSLRADAEGETVALYALLAVYVVVSLTIPFWVPIVQRHTGARGVYWVFSTLTYYAYLAWVIFATLLGALLYSWPPLGATWSLLLLLRAVQFYRLARRSPAALALPTGVAKGARSSPESGRRRSPESG